MHLDRRGVIVVRGGLHGVVSVAGCAGRELVAQTDDTVLVVNPCLQYKSQLALGFVLRGLWGGSPSVHVFHPVPSGDNGAAITSLFSSGGPGTTVLLVPAALYVLHTAINLSHPGTTLATQGFPTFASNQQAILETRGDKEAGAVHLYNLSNATLKRVHVRGCRGWGRRKPESPEEEERLRKEGKLGWIEGGGAMIWMGGPESTDAIVEGCRLEDPRGWTAVHVCDWGIRPKVLNNLVGPCGQEASGGPWADGLSVAGKESVIVGNTVFDATDGAIVVFCAPGSTIADNTIIARTRDLLGGINMVDDFPYDRDFSNTRVFGNTIRTEGDAYIRLGIGIGPTCWSPYKPWHKINYGGSVLHNYLGPGNLGYGIALSSAKDFTVLGNEVMASTSFIGDTSRFGHPVNAPPMAFVMEWKSAGRTEGCIVQPEFVEGDVSWLIGIESGVGERLEYGAGQLRLNKEGISASGEGGIRVRGARFEVGPAGTLDLREELAKDVGRIGVGRILWSSGGHSHGAIQPDPVLEFKRDGAFVITSGDKVLWNPIEYIASACALVDSDVVTASTTGEHEAHSSAVFSATSPYLTLKSLKGNVVYSTAYEYPRGYQLNAGNWIAIVPPHLRGTTHVVSHPAPPPIPTSSRPHFSAFMHQVASDLLAHPGGGPPPLPPRPSATCSIRPTFLFLDPLTHQVTLHSSASPTSPTPAEMHWVSSGPVEADSSWFVLQGDGNLVLYAKKGESIWVPWASGVRGVRMTLKGEGEAGGPALELWGEDGKKTFSTQP